MLREAAPKISKVAVIASRPVRRKSLGTALQGAAQSMGIDVIWPSDGPLNEAEYRRLFAALVNDGADAVIVREQNENWTHRQLIIELAERDRLPAIYPGQRSNLGAHSVRHRLVGGGPPCRGCRRPHSQRHKARGHSNLPANKARA